MFIVEEYYLVKELDERKRIQHRSLLKVIINGTEFKIESIYANNQVEGHTEYYVQGLLESTKARFRREIMDKVWTFLDNPKV